jgi:RecB family exonuclease
MTEETKHPLVLSASRMGKYEQCPQSYYWQYIEKLEKPERTSLIFGNVMHEVFETLIKNGEKKYHPTEAKILFENILTQTPLTEPKYYKDGLDIISLFFKFYPRFPSLVSVDEAPCVEHKFDMSLFNNDGDEVLVTGKIDRVDQTNNGIQVVDYKSGFYIPSYEDLVSSTQTKMYLMVIRKMFPSIENITFKFIYLREMKDVVINANDIDLINFESYLFYLSSRIKNDTTWVPQLNNFCSFCDFNAKCPKYQDAMNPDVIQNSVDTLLPLTIEQLVEKRVVLDNILKIADRKKKDIDGILLERIAHDGNFAVNGMQVGSKQMRKVSISPRSLVDAGCDVNTLCSVSTINVTQLRKIITNKDIMDRIMQASTTSYSSPYVVITHEQKGE